MSLYVGGKKWLFISSSDNFSVCSKYKVFGVDERYRVVATQLLSVGDKVFFYITRKKVFNGPWQIVQKGEYSRDHPAIYEWKPPGKYKIIVRLERVFDSLLEIPLDIVFDKLLFITNRKEYSDHFQFSIISIRDEDYNLLLSIDKKKTNHYPQWSSSEDLKELIRESGKFGVLQLLHEMCRKKNLYIEEEVQAVARNKDRAYVTIRNPKNGKEVRISLRESGYRVEKRYENQCWVGVSWKDYWRLVETPANSFVILADCINGNYVVIPFNAIKWRNYSSGKSFTVFITSNQEYTVNSTDPWKGEKVKKNTLEDILKALEVEDC